LGSKPLSPRQEGLARELLSEMHARRDAIRRPGGTRPRPAAAGAQGTTATAGSAPDRRADARLARVRARRRSLRESNQKFEAWARAHQDLVGLLRNFTDDPRVPFLRDLAIQVTHGWEGRRMPLSPRQEAAVKRIVRARPDLRSAHTMPAEPSGRTDPGRGSLQPTRRPAGPSRGAGQGARTAGQADLEAGQ
jgi:hypothetical protein